MNKSQSIIENTKKPETAKKLKVKDLTIQNPYDTETIERKTKSNMAKKLSGHSPKNANQFLHLMSKDSTIGLEIINMKINQKKKIKIMKKKKMKNQLKQQLILKYLHFLKMTKKDIKIEIEGIKDHFQQIIILVLFVI